MKRTFSVFISSVQKELAEERRAVKDYITRDPLLGRFFPDVFLFEDLPAQGQRPDTLYLQEIERRDIYLGIFGRKYGWKDASGLSPTAKEYLHATHDAARRPECLVFIKGHDDKEREPEMTRLIGQIANQVTRRRFTDIPSLIREIYESLVDFLEKRKLLRTLPFDAAPCTGTDLSSISADQVQQFLRLARERGRYRPSGSPGPKEVLSHFHLLADGVPTQAAIFLFGAAPARFLAQTQIQCLWFTGTEKRKPIGDQKVFEGTAFETIDAAEQFVLDKLVSRVGLATAGAAAPVRPEIPVFVVREAVVNAVAHRDYLSTGFVQIVVFSNRVEVWNPGHLPPGLSPQDLREPHGPVPHNPLVAEPLFRAGYAEKAGTGTTDMIDACRKAGLPEPDFVQRGPHFVVTLWRDWLTDEVLAGFELNDRQHEAVKMAKTRGRLVVTDYRALAGISKPTASRDLDHLVRLGLFLRIGITGRGTYYALNAKGLTKGSKGSTGRKKKKGLGKGSKGS